MSVPGVSVGVFRLIQAQAHVDCDKSRSTPKPSIAFQDLSPVFCWLYMPSMRSRTRFRTVSRSFRRLGVVERDDTKETEYSNTALILNDRSREYTSTLERPEKIYSKGFGWCRGCGRQLMVIVEIGN